MEKYETPSIPVIIDGVVDKWKAKDEWTFDKLYKNYGESKLRVGEDDDGYALRMKFKYFIEYMIFNKDDSPLYLFESSI